MPLVPQVCGKETDGPPERQETPSRPCCSISPTEQKLYTVGGRATHAVTAKAQKEIYCGRAKGTEERHLLPGAAQEYLLDQNHLLEGTEALRPGAQPLSETF